MVMKKPLWRSWLNHFHFLLEKVKYKNSEVKSSSVWRVCLPHICCFQAKIVYGKKEKI